VIKNLSHCLVRVTGRAASFCIAAILVAAWLLTGPLFHLSDLYRIRLKQKVKGTI